MEEFSPVVQNFADTFVALQDMRHKADYAFELEGWPNKQSTLAAIDRAENAIGQFEQADIRNRRCFVVHVMFKRRPS